MTAILPFSLPHSYIHKKNDPFIVWQVQAEIILGSPASKCAGLGICKVLPTEGRFRFRGLGIQAVIRLLSDGHLQFVFERSGMPDEMAYQYFTRLIFGVESTFNMPLWLQKQLGGMGPKFIFPGQYPIDESAEYFIVTL